MAATEHLREPVYRTALVVLHDAAAAEAVVEECFQRLQAEAAYLDWTQPFALWLHRLAIELSHARLQATAPSSRALTIHFHRFERLLMALGLDGREDPYAQFERAIQALPRHHRLVLTLYYQGGLRLKEIAHITQCPVGTVKSRLHYGRRALRRGLAQPARAPRAGHRREAPTSK